MIVAMGMVAASGSLAAAQTCISPGASFSFHSPFGATSRGNRVAQNFMMRNYPG